MPLATKLSTFKHPQNLMSSHLETRALLEGADLRTRRYMRQPCNRRIAIPMKPRKRRIASDEHVAFLILAPC